jgi:hypothetical protein
LGLFLIIFSWVPIVSQVLSWLTFLPLIYETKVANFLASFSWSSIDVSFPAWGIVIWYILLVGVIIRTKKNKILK